MDSIKLATPGTETSSSTFDGNKKEKRALLVCPFNCGDEQRSLASLKYHIQVQHSEKILTQQDVVSKMLQEQLTLCDSLAESIKNSQSSKTGVQDLMEAVAKRKYFEEELKKNEIEGERVSKELIEILFAKLHMQEKHGVLE